MIDRYGWAEQRQDGGYYVTQEDIRSVYEREGIRLTPGDELEVLAVLLFARYKGFGVIDTIREMDIDGVNGGTSGSLLPQIKREVSQEQRAENSVWVFYQGKQIHFNFLSYGTEDELRRITLALIRYGAKGSLTQNVGKVVSTAWDKARITALCPPASQCFAYFVRKFGFTGKTPEELLIKPYTQNGDLVIRLLYYLMRGQVTCAFTGSQGTGKTTLMTAIIRYIDPRYTIRTLEMAFEMSLRDLYPHRNILAVQETPFVSAATLQDTLKKTDAEVSIVGEVATDDVAARMIQMGLVASLFTLFSHHANTAEDLVLALRNSLVNAGGFPNMDTAERLVVDVVRVDVHLGKTPDGRRYVERVSEIIALPPGQPYPDYQLGSTDSMNEITLEYYRRSTDRRSFVTRDILRYDMAQNRYCAGEKFSDSLYESICGNLGGEAEEFGLFLRENWGEVA